MGVRRPGRRLGQVLGNTRQCRWRTEAATCRRPCLSLLGLDPGPEEQQCRRKTRRSVEHEVPGGNLGSDIQEPWAAQVWPQEMGPSWARSQLGVWGSCHEA